MTSQRFRKRFLPNSASDMLSEADSVMDGRSHMHGSTARVWKILASMQLTKS